MAHRIGVIGGGQLARMMIPPAIELGLDIRVLAESDDSSARIAATEVGDYRDSATVLGFARGVDVVTFDHEHVPPGVLRELEDMGVAVRPEAEALSCAQDKAVMRDRLGALGAPLPRWAVAETEEQVSDFISGGDGHQVVAKTPRGGYDGKGVRFIGSGDEVADWLALGPVLLEEKVRFVAEVAQLVARRPSGDMATWPLVETRQRDGVCSEVVAPAPLATSVHSEASLLARTIAEALGVTGVLAVEMFVLESGALVVNELAMRPHNSGHVFTELSVTSQFEQHLRAVMDLPLGSTELVAPAGVMVNVFGGVDHEALARVMSLGSRIKVHDYGKSARPGRKAGHVTVTGDDSPELLELGIRAASALTINGLT